MIGSDRTHPPSWVPPVAVLAGWSALAAPALPLVLVGANRLSDPFGRPGSGELGWSASPGSEFVFRSGFAVVGIPAALGILVVGLLVLGLLRRRSWNSLRLGTTSAAVSALVVVPLVILPPLLGPLAFWLGG